MQAEKKVCHYEVLGLDRKCDVDEIKKAYRQLALKKHPDKAHVNGISVEEATKNFQRIQEAYSVLSDPQERAWYDSHREQILKGHDDSEPAEDPFKTRINLYRYFSTSCFSGFGDDANGFFEVYCALFLEIEREEQEWEDLDSDEEHRPMPNFGRSDSDAAAVSRFYRCWLDFCSRKAFGHADKWNPKDAPTRQHRRAMEAENKKARQASKKEFNAEVRQLVKFVQKRDPRVLAQKKQEMKDSVEKKQRELAEKEERKANEAAERKERQEARRAADEARWAEAEAERQARRERGEDVTEDEEEEEEELVDFVCEPCKKRFQSEKTFDQHCKTKKHLQVVANFRKMLEKQDREQEKEERAKAAAAKFAPPARQVEESEESEDDDDDDDDEEPRRDVEKQEEESEDEDDADALLTKLAKGGAQKQRDEAEDESEESEGGGSSSSSSSKSSSSESPKGPQPAQRKNASPAADAAAEVEGSGRRAQKKAQQQALQQELLQKRTEAEAGDRPSGGRKAQKAAKKAEAAAAADGVPVSGAGGDERCGVCGEAFPSRSKLFQHIRTSGHAMLKPVIGEAPEASKSGKGKKKKR